MTAYNSACTKFHSLSRKVNSVPPSHPDSDDSNLPEFTPNDSQSNAFDSNTSFVDSGSTADLLPGLEFVQSQSTTGDSADQIWASELPKTIGKYTPISILGQGGMGVVYLAIQAQPIERQVALKVIKSGRDSKDVIARFETERQALALMNHKNIAKVFDGGITEDGSPYFVMELVDGLPLNEFCCQHDLSLEQRLQLIVEICDGIEHAHQKGVIHRDLKPSNILVIDDAGGPVPKIIDFGLAKATGASGLTTEHTLTGMGQVLGTVQYMSPEQAQLDSLDIDTRTDIYSIGIILYELITGITPIRTETMRGKGIAQVLLKIQQREPSRPSKQLSTQFESSSTDSQPDLSDNRTLRRIQSELDWIVMKCLSIDRSRRYPSASRLAEDMNNFLLHQPVSARPPSAFYRVSKLIQRNRGYTALGVSLVATLIVATVVGFMLAAKANASAERANKMADKANRMADKANRMADQANRSANDANDARQRSELAKQRALSTVEKVQELVLDSPVWNVNNSGRTALIDLLSKEYQYWGDDIDGADVAILEVAANLTRLGRKENEMLRKNNAADMANEAIRLVDSHDMANSVLGQITIAEAETVLVSQLGDDEHFLQKVEEIRDRVKQIDEQRMSIELKLRGMNVIQELARICHREREDAAFSLNMDNRKICDRLLVENPGNQEFELIKVRTLNQEAISRRKGVIEKSYPGYQRISNLVPIYDQSIEMGKRLYQTGFRPVPTATLLAKAISNRGLSLVGNYRSDPSEANKLNIQNNYEEGIEICDQLLAKYPDNLKFKELQGLLKSNYGAAFEAFSDWESEERFRNEADQLLTLVVEAIGVDGSAGDLMALNRVHFVKNQARLGKTARAVELAASLFPSNSNLVDDLEREFFPKLFFYQLVSTKLNLTANEKQYVEARVRIHFESVMKQSQGLSPADWHLLTKSSVFEGIRNDESLQELWVIGKALNEKRNDSPSGD